MEDKKQSVQEEILGLLRLSVKLNSEILSELTDIKNLFLREDEKMREELEKQTLL